MKQIVDEQWATYHNSSWAGRLKLIRTIFR